MNKLAEEIKTEVSCAVNLGYQLGIRSIPLDTEIINGTTDNIMRIISTPDKADALPKKDKL